MKVRGIQEDSTGLLQAHPLCNYLPEVSLMMQRCLDDAEIIKSPC